MKKESKKSEVKILISKLVLFAIVLTLIPVGTVSAESDSMDDMRKPEVRRENSEMRERLDQRVDPRLRAKNASSTSSTTVKKLKVREEEENRGKNMRGDDMRRNSTSTATSSRNNRGKGDGNGAICSRIISNEAQIIANLTKSFKNKDGARKDNMMKMRDERDEKIDEKRSLHDENKELRFEKLEASANTDAKKAAVAKFKTTMEAAITTRRTAIDLAITTYRKDVDAIIAKYPLTNPASTTASALEAAAKAAIAKAKTECMATSSDQQLILKNFQASLEKLKKDYRSTASSSANAKALANSAMKTELKAAADKREASVKAARDAFKTVYDVAKAELRTAFGS